MTCSYCEHVEDRPVALFCCLCGRPLLPSRDPYLVAAESQKEFVYWIENGPVEMDSRGRRTQRHMMQRKPTT